jgi:hypothetical protein
VKRINRSVLVLICISILFCGCSVQTDTTTVNVAEKNKGLVEISELVDENINFISSDFYEDTLLLFGSIETSDIEFYDYIYIVDASKNKLLKEHRITEIDCQSIAGAEFDDDGNILVYDDYNETAGLYDTDCNFLRSQSYSSTYYDATLNDNPLVSNGLFDNYGEFVRFYRNEEIGKRVCALDFFDEPDVLYLVDDKSESVVASSGRKVLSTLVSDSTSSVTFGVYDYENEVLINQTTSVNFSDNSYPSFTAGAINDKYAFVSLSVFDDDDNYIETPYIWEYTTCALNSSIGIEKANLEQLNTINDDLIADIENDYSIQIDVDKETKDGFDITYGTNPFDVYYLLVQLKQCLTYFPDGFIDEMHTDFNLKEYETDKLYIDIVSEIDGASAYALELKNEIVFSTAYFNTSIISHEFMHIIESRIADYYYPTDTDFEIEWEKFIPDDFVYGDDSNELDNQQNFVSSYSMESSAEDKAEIFMNLFEEGKSDSLPSWYDSTTPLGKKTDYLCDSIRKAFPSVQNSDSVFWENCLKRSVK